MFRRDEGGPDAWGLIAWITADDGAYGDLFGWSVAINGDTAIVGAYRDDDNGSDSGSAYIFSRDQGGSNNWGQLAKITPADGARNASFGWSVAINDDTAIVGALSADNGWNSGSAHVFRRDNGGPDAWGQINKITPDDGAEGDRFGNSVAVSGDTAVVGASSDDDTFEDSGSVYVFQRNQGGTDAWGLVVKQSCPPVVSARWDVFGRSVAISGDTAVVGACYDDDHGLSSGSAYIFQRNEGGLDAWGKIVKITPFDGSAGNEFGYSVAINGDTAVVSAPGDDENGPDSGSAYVFQRAQGGTDAWGQVAKMTPADGAEEDYFGTSVAISGNTAVVGAYIDDDSGFNSGSAYLFQRDQGGPNAWGQLTKIVATDGAPGDYFGWSVSLSNDTAIVGAYCDDDYGPDSGSAYVFNRDQGGFGAWGQVAKMTAADGSGADRFGWSVAISGDTAVVGSVTNSAYVFERDHGGPDAWSQVAKIADDEGTSYTYFGRSVATSGNTTVVGAPGDEFNYYPGSTYIYRRDQSGPGAWGQIAKITAAGGAAVNYFGWSVSISGDTAIVGGWGDNELGVNAGAAYVFLISDILFVDDFETGNTSGWASTVP